MRVCPKCGYRDPDCWAPMRWRREVDVTARSEFALFYPDLNTQFDEGHIVVTDEHNAYCLSKSRVYVRRIWIGLYEAFGMSAFTQRHAMEHVDHMKSPNQTKLLEKC